MDYLSYNVDISWLSNYKTPAKARYYFELSDTEDIDKILEIVTWAKENNTKILWVSWGTNMLFAFDTYDGIVIKNSLAWWTYNSDSKILVSYGSEPIWNIAELLEKNYWQALWHRFIWLPGSVAWAVYGNAWCFGLETENNFVSCEVLDLEDGSIKTLYKEDMKFSYRSSILKLEKKYFLINATFDLSKKIEKYHSEVDNIDFRENKQPKWNTCGSFFKNPSKEYSAGRLIEEVGLKWFHHWWAFFSELHANFLMFDGKWSYTDLLELIEIAQEKVKKQFDIEITPEVRIIHN